ncbi:hypothetical protein D3C80_1183890 [compost metagenome]
MLKFTLLPVLGPRANCTYFVRSYWPPLFKGVGQPLLLKKVLAALLESYILATVADKSEPLIVPIGTGANLLPEFAASHFTKAV